VTNPGLCDDKLVSWCAARSGSPAMINHHTSNQFSVTWTVNSNIISMTTVVSSDANSTMRTVQQMGLISGAEKISKPYGTTSSTIKGIHS